MQFLLHQCLVEEMRHENVRQSLPGKALGRFTPRRVKKPVEERIGTVPMCMGTATRAMACILVENFFDAALAEEDK